MLPRQPRRTEPTAWLCPARGQPRLNYVPYERTDIRVLFASVRAALAGKTTTDARVATLPRRAPDTNARKA